MLYISLSLKRSKIIYMSSKVNDFLHELIHSLSKSEKRYFKLLSSRHTIGDENNYITLFDFIDKQEKYDENELKVYFKAESFLTKFSITKKRLYDHILNALDNYHSQSSIESQLFKMIHGAEILSHKSLYSQAKKLLISAQKLAEKQELTSILLLIRIKFKALLEKNNYLDIQESQINEILAEDEALLERSDDEAKLWNLKSKLFLQMAHHGVARNDRDKLIYFGIWEQLKKLSSPKKPSLESVYLRNHIESAYYFSTQDSENSFVALQNNLDLFKKNEKLIKQHPDRYISILTNLIYTAEHLCMFEIAESYFLDLKQQEENILTTVQDTDLQIKLFSTISSIELAMLTQKGNYHDSRKTIDKIKEGLTNFDGSISAIRKAFLWFKITCIHLANLEPHLALKTVRKILNDAELDKKEDIVSFAHLLELFIHIELGDLDYLNYATKATKRFLTSRNRLFLFEQELLGFVSKFGAAKNKCDQIDRWELLHKSLLTLAKDPYQASALDYFDFITWAEAKTKNTNFVLLCKEKFNNGLSTVAS